MDKQYEKQNVKEKTCTKIISETYGELGYIYCTIVPMWGFMFASANFIKLTFQQQWKLSGFLLFFDLF